MSTLLKILQIIPALIGVIKAVEEMIPESGKGKYKLELIQTILQESYDGITDMWPMLEKIIGQIVETLNALGIFSKSE